MLATRRRAGAAGAAGALAAFAWMVLVPWSYALAWTLLVGSLLHPLTCWLPALYLVWLCVDWDTPERGGRTWSFYKNSPIWRYLMDYFPIKIVKTADLDASKNYLLCTFPHGFMPIGTYVGVNTAAGGMDTLYPGTTTKSVVLSLNFKVPIVRDIVMAVGGVPSSEAAIVQLLRSPGGGRLVTLMVGGAAEATLLHPDRNHIVLRRRTGFCRIALQEGVPLVPVFTFGENRCFKSLRFPGLGFIQKLVMKVSGFAPIIPIGAGYLKLLPKRVPLTVIIGAPIPVERVSNPSKEEIVELRNRFEQALVEMYNKYLPICHPGEDIPLIIE